jgi:hypothetical protein
VSLDRLLQAFTATVQKRGPSTTTRDVFNTPIEDEAPLLVTYPCWLEQLSTQEMLVGRDTVLANYRAFFLPDADIDADDAIPVIVHNETGHERGPFEVVGQPSDMSSFRGEHHIEALLRSVSG